MLQFGIFLHSLVVGFMIFFVAVVSPTIFKVLDETNSGTFLRQLFPRMFLYGLIAMLLAFLTTLNSQLNIYWIISAISSVLFAINLYIITPKINYHRDEAKLGNSLSEKKFKQFHLFSVVLFILQLLGSLYLLLIYYY
ncbi:DUF4149 domain-containing protein [Pelagibacterales bacterium SAG-MED32]|nr:DUF4149 domain-containing protein [Pelagibacterales bacterium SAG-MED32]